MTAPKYILLWFWLGLIFLSGCTDSQDMRSMRIFVQVSFTDRIEADYSTLYRQVGLSFSGPSSEIVSRMVTQATREGWHLSPSDTYSFSVYKKFNLLDVEHEGVFTQLFGPYYYRNPSSLELNGYINPKIKAVIKREARIILQSYQIPYTTISRVVDNIYFSSVIWKITIPSNEVKSNFGNVSTPVILEGNRKISVIQYNMHEGEFLSGLPIKITYKEWLHYIWYVLLFAGITLILNTAAVTCTTTYINKTIKNTKIYPRAEEPRHPTSVISLFIWFWVLIWITGDIITFQTLQMSTFSSNCCATVKILVTSITILLSWLMYGSYYYSYSEKCWLSYEEYMKAYAKKPTVKNHNIPKCDYCGSIKQTLGPCSNCGAP